MSAPDHPQTSGADGFETLKDMLSVVRKQSRSNENWDFPYVSSAIKKYVHAESAIVVTKMSTGFESGYYHLLFLRVPRREETSAAGEHCIGEFHTRQRHIGSKADGVLVVRQLGYFPDKVFSAGKAWASLMWLLPCDLINDDLGQSGFRFALPLVDDSFDASQAISPRVVLGEPEASVGLGRSEQGLVEGMLDVQEGVPEWPSDLHWKCFDQSDLEDPLSGFSIELSHRSDCTILRVSRESLFGSINARLCPVDVLLRRFESGHD